MYTLIYSLYVRITVPVIEISGSIYYYYYQFYYLCTYLNSTLKYSLNSQFSERKMIFIALVFVSLAMKKNLNLLICFGI